MSGITIRPALPDEADVLSQLAGHAQQGALGYSDAFIEACRADLTVDPAQCDGASLLVATVDDRIAGFARIAGSPPRGELADLWVDPAHMGKGVGRALFKAITAQAHRLRFQALHIGADPHAEAFYLHLGAVRIGETPSTVDPNRMLPLLRLTL